MTTTAPLALESQFASAVSALAAVDKDVTHYQAADDAALLELSRLAAQQRRLADVHLALVVGEIAHRSSRELGHSGLAQQQGFRSPEEFVQATTGSTGREATTAVKVGRLVREAATAGDIDPLSGVVSVAAEPWLADVAAAVTAGQLSVTSAEAIGSGLGKPTDDITAVQLAGAASLLLAEARSLDSDRLLRRARELRDELDEAGIADRESALIAKRSLRHYRLSDGMGEVRWRLDPESYAHFVELYDRATSPKRGVRFVSGSNKEKADRILADPRSIEQLASDTLLGILQAGADADPSQLLGSGGASVRVLVTRATLEAGSGHGRIDGQSQPVSVETVERLACNGGTTPVEFDTFGQALDVGREQRFFTRKQRIALSVRDGGCRFPSCQRLAAFSEAHHIKHWARDGGETNIADGILLCKFHHLLVHNNHWEIERVGSEYFLRPPPDVDPARTPTPMPSKSAAMRDLRRELELVGTG